MQNRKKNGKIMQNRKKNELFCCKNDFYNEVNLSNAN